MVGDAAWHSCGCPENQKANDSNVCVDLPGCVLVWNDETEELFTGFQDSTAAPTQAMIPDQVQVIEAEPELAIGIIILLIIVACLFGAILGFWCGLQNVDTSQVAPVGSPIARQHSNLMYVSAPSPVYDSASVTSRREEPLPTPPQAWEN